MAVGSRRRARAYALQVLYALDLSGDVDYQNALERTRRELDVDVEGDVLGFAKALVELTRGRLGEVDEAIRAASRNWRLERMSRVDRNILRLATAELLFSPEVPTKVAIN